MKPESETVWSKTGSLTLLTIAILSRLLRAVGIITKNKPTTNPSRVLGRVLHGRWSGRRVDSRHSDLSLTACESWRGRSAVRSTVQSLRSLLLPQCVASRCCCRPPHETYLQQQPQQLSILKALSHRMIRHDAVRCPRGAESAVWKDLYVECHKSSA